MANELENGKEPSLFHIIIFVMTVTLFSFNKIESRDEKGLVSLTFK